MKRIIEAEMKTIEGREALVVSSLGDMSLKDTLECGQAFRYEELRSEGDYIEYLTVAMDKLLIIGQRKAGELIFYGMGMDDLPMLTKYFCLDLDYSGIKALIVEKTDSEWMKQAAECSKGIHILKQDAWEALFSFIISQNNNIPRIRKIIRRLAAEYGENLAIKQGAESCPKGLCRGIDESVCKECGICYSFPTARAVFENPDGMKPANTGFRFKYLLDAARRVHLGECDLEKIEGADSFDEIMVELKKILGVGDKVASCVALFGMGRLEAFPIDVWMKRAIDEYFDGKLDYTVFEAYAGVAQQYIFHYIRNLSEN